MKLAMNAEQAQHLYQLYNDRILAEKPREIDDKLVMLHMLSIYKKLRTRMEDRSKQTFSVTISDVEALAYSCFFRYYPLHDYPYEANFIMGQLAAIDQQVTVKLFAFEPAANGLPSTQKRIA